MRHPFWRWTGWLSIGLTGCLHGQDWRAAVAKPTARAVVDRHESRPVPKVVGPFRSGAPKFAPPADVVTPTLPSTAVVRKPTVPQEVALPSTSKPVPQPHTAQVVTAEHRVPPTTSAVLQTVSGEVTQKASPAAATPSPIIAEQPRSDVFAEFERAIPLRQPVAKSLAPVADDLVESVVVQRRKFEPQAELPIITPANAIASTKPSVVQVSHSKSSESGTSDNQPRSLFSKSAVPAKELPDVTETTTAASAESHREEGETAVRPHDVSILVEQVFEDLRQRRLTDARKRTDWLKQLVKQRESVNSANTRGEVPQAESSNAHSGEPRRLDADPQATAVEKSAPETFFDDDESSKSQ